jgi:hypothetical protein
MRVPVLGDFAMSKVQGRLINPTEFDSPATVALRQRALDSFDMGFSAHSCCKGPS